MSHYVTVGAVDPAARELAKQSAILASKAKSAAAAGDAAKASQFEQQRKALVAAGLPSSLPGGDVELPGVGSVPVVAIAGAAALVIGAIVLKKMGKI